jgi:hypothetical protein
MPNFLELQKFEANIPPTDSDNISETFMQSEFRHKIVNLKKTGKKESLQLQQQ